MEPEIDTLSMDLWMKQWKRHTSELYSLSMESTASTASTATASGPSLSSMSGSTNPSGSAGPTNTLGPGNSPNPGSSGSLTTAVITTAIATGGSTILTTFTTTATLTDTLGLPGSSISTRSGTGTALPVTSSTSVPTANPSQFQIGASEQAICAGQGLDTQSIGALSTLIFSAAVGLIIWILFAFLRPRVRSLYGLREWFLSPGLRPPALSNGFFAFLHPPVPLVPGLPSNSDIDEAREARINPQPGQATPDPCQLLTSDDQLAQRTLWIVFLICLVWSLVALVIGLPLYMVETPCLPRSGPDIQYGGRYGTLQDLSVLRLLRMMDDGTLNPTSSKVGELWRRLVNNGRDLAPNAYGRLIGLCVIVIVLAILPALWKLWNEFRKLSNYNKAWNELRCEGFEMGYLSCGTGNSIFLGNRGGAWGWRGWGEGKVKAFFRQAGLGGGTGLRVEPIKPGERAALAGPSEKHGRRHREQPSPGSSEERADAEINVTSVFSVGDTSRLSELLEERDIILDNLEIAEARYISSFQPITPSPSPSLRSTVPLPTIPASPTDGQNTSDSNAGIFSTLSRKVKSRPMSISSSSSDPNRDLKSQISRPRPLRGTYSRDTRGYTPMIAGPVYPPNLSQNIQTTKNRGRNRSNSATTAEHSDKTPTTYLAPSQYYKLRGVTGASGGRLGSEQELSRVTKGEGQASRTNGFGDAIRSKLTGTRFLEVNRDSTVHGKIPLGSKLAVDEQGVLSPIELSKGPNYGAQDEEGHMQEPTSSTFYQRDLAHTPEGGTSVEDHEMVVVEDASEIPEDLHANPASARPRPPKQGRSLIPPSVRETFPMRAPKGSGSGAEEPPPHLRLQSHQPFHRPISGLDHDALSAIYANIRHWRGALKAINREIADVQEQGFEDLAEGQNIKGWVLVGKGLRFLPGVELIEGRSKEDIRWDELQRGDGMWSDIAFWVAVCVIGLLLGVGLLAAAGLALATSPDVVHYLPFLSPVVAHNNVQSGLATALAPAIAASIFIGLAMLGIHKAASQSGAVSVTAVRIKAFKAVFWVIVIVSGIWIVAAASILFGAHALDTQQREAPTIANGTIAMAIFLLFITINIAIIVPGLLLLQPVRLWKMHRRKKRALTPRQQFRAMYPKLYNPIYGMGCCILGIVFVCAFAILFPLIAPAVLVLVLLTLVAHRFLIGYVYGKTDSGQTGGLLQLWVLRRFATLLSLQPILLGLIALSRRKWVLGGIMIGIAIGIIIVVEWYCSNKLKRPGVESLSPVTRDAIESYVRSARPAGRSGLGGNDNGAASSTNRKGKGRRAMNGSISSVLDMMSITLAVMPGPNRKRPPVPLPTEQLDDLIATEKAARTHPDAPPRLPPLAFVDHAEEMSGILYPPELTAPPPVIWLPNDSAGIARSEAYDLQQYHHLTTVIDVRAPADVMTPRNSDDHRREQKSY
ncbi:hypothetical protein FRC17_009553 [Serendipita sp. 399]|nr:hypothetical protein FRC17_009553 [Serendipita sp. 399]